ncbi:glucosamine-6-phosphate deaminase [Duganella sacchari]|uniref:Glucosamine-6-phosphate deaminase n=1 Tax=Duganella sacchari TaxID=551987 RepID=A0A1M7P665_9BURK|nr:6-phosphogluconolactonase [Duganella sacchari]SHN12131.1 glucosamine-6-phosphate deaminase [Duganella sacchari]
MHAAQTFPHVAALKPWFHSGQHTLQIFDTEEVARTVAARLVSELADVLRQKPYAVLTPSVGRTMVGIFDVLRDQHRNSIDWQRVICVQMDEYAHMPSSDPDSFALTLRRDLVEPLGIGRFIHFYDDEGAAIVSPKQYEEDLYKLGGIDCALHGVGRNSHIGFNEPRQRTRLTGGIVRLSQATRIANGVPYRHGVSLGLGVLRAAQSSILVLLGEHKRDASYQLLFGSSGPHVPVTQLRHCPRVSICLDHAAVPDSLSNHDFRATPRLRMEMPAAIA